MDTTDKIGHAERQEIREFLQRHYGAMATIARELGVTRTAMWLVLSGRSESSRIMRACRARVQQIILEEMQHGEHTQFYPGNGTEATSASETH